MPSSVLDNARHALDWSADRDDSQRIAEVLHLLEKAVPLRRRIVRAGDAVCRTGERFDCLHVLNSGLFKVVNTTADGREQMVGLKFKGDWLGFEGIAGGRYGCDAIAMDTGEVWSLRYEDFLAACAAQPGLVVVLHAEMSREIARDRDSMMSLCTLPADARVADFLRSLARSLSLRGLRTDQITLRLTRAEIGNYLGMTLETVSRALSRLARENVIGFADKSRRDLRIPDAGALSRYVDRCSGMAAAA